jgi:membrane protease YdiL (CAAX protease family)
MEHIYTRQEIFGNSTGTTPGDNLMTMGIIFASIILAIILGKYFRSILPDRHTWDESRDTLKLICAMMATVTGLIIGLMVTSANATYKASNDYVTTISSNIIDLDYFLAKYGADAREERLLLRLALANGIQKIWPEQDWLKTYSPLNTKNNSVTEEEVFDNIRELKVNDDKQQYLKTRALERINDLLKARSLLKHQARNSPPRIFLTVLISWIVVLFFHFGILSPQNRTVTTSLFITAFLLSATIFIIIELESPLDGFFRISSAPLQYAIGTIGKI